MGVLLQKPDVKYFGSLPHICQAVKHFNSFDTETLIKEVGAIFVKHNVTDHFGLVLVHRHFQMTDKELLVETSNANGTLNVAFPWTIKGDTAEPGDSSLITKYSLTPGKFIIPLSWAFSSQTNTLVAYEFVSHPSEELPPPPEDFSKELHSALQSRGLHSLIGIRRLLNLRRKNSWEVTPSGIRANVTRIGTTPPPDILESNMVKVIWAFDPHGQLLQVGGCQNCNKCDTCVCKAS